MLNLFLSEFYFKESIDNEKKHKILLISETIGEKIQINVNGYTLTFDNKSNSIHGEYESYDDAINRALDIYENDNLYSIEKGDELYTEISSFLSLNDNDRLFNIIRKNILDINEVIRKHRLMINRCISSSTSDRKIINICEFILKQERIKCNSFNKESLIIRLLNHRNEIRD